MNIYVKSVLMAVLCIAMTVGGGCRSKKNVNIDGFGSEFNPENIGGGGTYALSDNKDSFENGTRIRDVQLDNVMFDYDSFQLANSELPKIEKAVDYMRANSGVKLVLEGNCDERGSREYNMSLGEYRALAVRAHMIGLGIDSARIQTRSYGEENPVDPGHNEQAWRLNRRVEFALYR